MRQPHDFIDDRIDPRSLQGRGPTLLEATGIRKRTGVVERIAKMHEREHRDRRNSMIRAMMTGQPFEETQR